MTETKWLDTPIGIWENERMVAIGYMWDVYYLKRVVAGNLPPYDPIVREWNTSEEDEAWKDL